MAKKRLLSPQSVYDERLLAAAFQKHGVKEVHIAAIYKHLARHPDAAFTDVPDLPKAAIELLETDFARLTSRVVECQTSSDGQTSKLLVQLQDGLQAEAVIMHYDTTARGDMEAGVQGSGGKRATLCVSSEVGCQMGCTFCATGTMGLVGDLTAGEIVEQLVHARTVTPIRNVVFMGMGEPLNNYEAVRGAVRAMTDPRTFGLRRSAVTVSTVGVIPRILQLVDDLPGVSLALSLHAPSQELRQRIVPSAAAYKLDRLMAAVETYQQRTKQRVFIEYVMLAHVNDNAEQAHQLGALLRGRDIVLNLIPWNPIFSPTIDFQAPGASRVTDFQRIVHSEYGIQCTVRQEKGQDIAGACGQLVVAQGGGSGCSASKKGVADIEELAKAAPVAAAIAVS